MIRYKRAASQDSEDGAQISSAAPDEPSSSSSGSGRSSPPNNGHINGHLDRKQRLIYVSLFIFSLFNALVGLTLVVVWMLKYRAVTGFGLQDKDQLANVHPLMMYMFMISLNMYAVLIYRTHYSAPKQTLKWAHAILAGVNITMSLLGVAAMYKAHLMGNMANFYSLHSWIGVLTNGVYLSQFVFGFVAFLKPGMTQQKRAALMPWHRLVGTMLLVLAALAAITGISELVIFQNRDNAYQQFEPITFIANFAGIATILMTATSVYLVTAPQYRRPAVAGHAGAPIKR